MSGKQGIEPPVQDNHQIQQLGLKIIVRQAHKENKKRFWTWCFRADAYTLFKIADTRGSRVLIDIIGEDFAGVIGCDYFSAYRKYMKDFDVLIQFCIAHLIRELKYLVTVHGYFKGIEQRTQCQNTHC